MYNSLLTLHSIFRWLALLSLLYAIFLAYRGWLKERSFSAIDNKVRHWTATIAHIQLTIGLSLYFTSPIIDYFWENYAKTVKEGPIRFFGMEHSLMMLVAVILITLGSAKAKRKPTDRQKFKTMAIWFSIALVIILINIPWPFSPWAVRPWLRGF